MAVDASQRGLPRPILEGLPAPYSGENNLHGHPHYDRLMECVNEDVCAVCGDAVPDEIVYVATHAGDSLLLMDQGVLMHERCARLSLAHCPHMRYGFSTVFWVRRNELVTGPAKTYRDLTPEAWAQMNARRLMISSTSEAPDMTQPWRPPNEPEWNQEAAAQAAKLQEAKDVAAAKAAAKV